MSDEATRGGSAPTRGPQQGSGWAGLMAWARTGATAALRGLLMTALIPVGALLVAALGLVIAAPMAGVIYTLTTRHPLSPPPGAFATPRHVSSGKPVVFYTGPGAHNGLQMVGMSSGGKLTIIAVCVVWAAVAVPLLALAILTLVRKLATETRSLIADWTGLVIPSPYRPRPAGRNRILWVMTDPATWRDVAWMLVAACAGWFLVFAPAFLFGLGVGSLFRLITGESGLLAWAPVPQQIAVTAAVVGAGLWLAPAFLRVYGVFAETLLAPTSRANLSLRISHLSQTRTETIDAGAAEIRRIERDLHDGAQARLVAMGMTLDAAGQLIDENPAAARALLLEARDNSARALAELRSLVRGILPPVLADRGLADAVRALALDAPLRTHVAGGLDGRPPAPVESAAYFAVSELLANVSKHAAARQVWIDLRHSDGMLKIGVTDDGHGGADPAAGTGLRGIERRLAAFDGVVAISSPPGGPTAVTMEVPCELSSARTSSS
jgi:signal transduction histidine kinase